MKPTIALIVPLGQMPGYPDNSLPGVGAPVDPGYGQGTPMPPHVGGGPMPGWPGHVGGGPMPGGPNVDNSLPGSQPGISGPNSPVISNPIVLPDPNSPPALPTLPPGTVPVGSMLVIVQTDKGPKWAYTGPQAGNALPPTAQPKS